MTDPISTTIQQRVPGLQKSGKHDSAHSVEKAVESRQTLRLNTVASAQSTQPVDTIDVSLIDQNDLSDRIGRLTAVLDEIANSVSIIRETQTRLDSISGLLEQAGGTAIRARDILDAAGNDRLQVTERIDELANRLSEIIVEIDRVAEGATSRPNLLQGESLVTRLGEAERAQVVTTGIFITAGGLGILPVKYAERAEAQGLRDTVVQALDELKVFKQELVGDVSELQTRQDFTLNSLQIVSDVLDAPLLSSAEDQTANLLALQLRQDLAGTSASLAGDAQRALLQQF